MYTCATNFVFVVFSAMQGLNEIAWCNCKACNPLKLIIILVWTDEREATPIIYWWAKSHPSMYQPHPVFQTWTMATGSLRKRMTNETLIIKLRMTALRKRFCPALKSWKESIVGLEDLALYKLQQKENTQPKSEAVELGSVICKCKIDSTVQSTLDEYCDQY